MSLNQIKNFGKKLGLKFQDKENGIYQLWHPNGFTFIEFKHVHTYLNTYYADDLEIEDDEINQNEYFFSFWLIFRSWHVSNDRTDFNDITSSTIASFLRLFSQCSFKLIDIEHPVIEDELYGRELIPTQNINFIVDFSNHNLLGKVEKLLVDFIISISMLFDWFNCSSEKCDEYSYSSDALNDWKKMIPNEFCDNDSIIYNSRTNPEWFYFKSDNVSIVKNSSVCQLFRGLIMEEYRIETVDGVNGKLLLENNIKNFVSNVAYESLEKIFCELEEHNGSFFGIPLDNVFTGIGEEHLIFFKGDFDFDRYVKEKEIIKQRHIKESIILFAESTPNVTINSHKDTEIFENLILDLLKRESYIFSAKKVAPTNEADNGRDIICKFNLKHKKQSLLEDEIELDYKKLIVQCKTKLASSKKQSIGKSDVNIVDTIYDYRPDGYILVTNTQTTTRLTEHLENIEEREKIYVDWWNKEDIEERLINYPELIQKYSTIIQ